jgi:hypothetical protein
VAWLGVSALLSWYAALPDVDLRAMTDLGMVSVLPPASYIAFLLLAIAWAVTLAQPRFPTWLAAGLVITLILMLYGLAPAAEGVTRFSPAWRHLGIVDFITRQGAVQPSLDAYHNWPGMFALASFLGSVTGIGDPTPAALWAPVWFNLLFLPPLLLVLSALTDDRRHVWLAIWLFYLADWIGQDYFSPQALGLLLFLVILAVTVRWLAAGDRRDDAPIGDRSPVGQVRRIAHRLLARGPLRVAELTPGRRAGLVAAAIVIYSFIVTEHQLTPFFIVACFAALVILLRVPWPSLPILMMVMIASWVSFVAVAFLIGHFQNVAGYVGALAESLTANLTGRLQGSDAHRTVVYLRLATTALVWLMATLGVIRRLRNGRWDVTAVALGVAPFPLLAVQAYGGEMLLRIYLFALPFAAFLAAALIVPMRTERSSIRGGAAIMAVSVVLMAGFIVGRYGNERMEYFTPNEVAAVADLYRVAPAGSLLVAATPNLPWKNTRYEEYHYRPIGDDTLYGRVDELIATMQLYPGRSFLILSRSQEAYAEMILGAPAGDWSAFEKKVMGTGRFLVIYQNQDAQIAEFQKSAPGG